jgi:glycosyltransferase involved in cell wall biosynthesis
MRIAVDTLSQTIGGGISVARHLVDAMARSRPEAKLSLYCSSPDLARAAYPLNVEIHFLPLLRSLLQRILWQQLVFPKVLREGRFDVLLALGGFSVFTSRVPQVSVWQNPNIFTRLRIPWSARIRAYIGLQRAMQGLSMRKASLNVFLSNDSLHEAKTRWPMRSIPHVVIHNGIADDHQDESPGKEEVATEAFALAVGHSYFHKNYDTLIDAMECLDSTYGGTLKLQIAGGAVDAAYQRSLEQRIEKKGLQGVVKFLGPLSAHEVSRLYRQARLHVLTSLLESFGLTPLEAMKHGLPVLASKASCIPEICGDAALYCDPLDPQDIAQKLHDLSSDESLRAQLRERGFARVMNFSWQSRAREYWQAIDRCLTFGRSPVGGGRILREKG